MEVNRDDADEFLQNFFEQLESLSLSEEAEVAETTDPWNINALLEPLPSQFQKQAIPQQAPTYDAARFLKNLDQLLGPDTVYTEDQSVQFGSNKRTIAVNPTQQLFSSNLNQCYRAETSTRSINPTFHTGRSPSQVLFTVPTESIHFTHVGSSVDTCASSDSNQHQPRKRQRR
ncbi:uncharacterized protein LOC103867635 [Brassica rapa]|uniref:Uncharacterized protein n=2 Tax=Brassica TaxID=3705 RepID=M4CMZ5_BRACM|nr:uncharacterized protein LOC103867635 [Brassica rapa]CAF2096146.1 unnamed protein product [Brassica napus]